MSADVKNFDAYADQAGHQHGLSTTVLVLFFRLKKAQTPLDLWYLTPRCQQQSLEDL